MYENWISLYFASGNYGILQVTSPKLSEVDIISREQLILI